MIVSLATAAPGIGTVGGGQGGGSGGGSFGGLLPSPVLVGGSVGIVTVTPAGPVADGSKSTSI